MAEKIINTMQKKAIESLDRHILLTASAGTGKTNTLAYRVKNIIEQNVAKPNEILCITFTNKACNEMRERIISLVGEKGQGVIIHTFHSFCYYLIRSEAKLSTDISWDTQIIDEDDSVVLFSDAIADLNKRYKETKGFVEIKWADRIIANLIEYVKLARTENLKFSSDEWNDYKETIDDLYENDANNLLQKCSKGGNIYSNIPMELAERGAELFLDYNHRLRENHVMDFSDLILYAWELLQNKEIKKRWSNMFKYINIDEVQDTSMLEYKIISSIFGKSKLLLCGDYFQTIFEWRGSDPDKVLAEYESKYQPDNIAFYKNYRATQILVDASFASISNMFPAKVADLYRKGIKPASDTLGEPISYYRAANPYAEARWIFYQIYKLWQEKGNSILRDTCILTRNNRENINLSVLLYEINEEYRNNGKQAIPFMLVDEFKFYRRQEIKDAIAFLRLIRNKHDIGSLMRIMKRFVRGIGKASIDTITSEVYRKAGIALTDFIDPISHEYCDPYGLLIRQLNKDNIVVFDVESTGLDVESDEIIQIAAIRINKVGDVIDKFVTYVKANKAVGQSEWVHHISDATLKEKGMDQGVALKNFCKFAENAVIVGHNVSFDIAILTSQLRRLNLAEISFRGIYDTLDIFRRFHPNLENHKLEYLGEYCNVKHKSSHDAFDDIMATAEILLYAMKWDILPNEAQRSVYIGKHLEKFRGLTNLLEKKRNSINDGEFWQFVSYVIKDMKVADYYKNTEVTNDIENTQFNPAVRTKAGRLENLRHLVRQASVISKDSKNNTEALDKLLKLASLSNTEIDCMLRENPRIPILTVHQVKGAEFDYVFLAECREGVFPSYISIKSNTTAEEARLFYVSITRARKKLYITYPRFYDRNKFGKPSRYISSIPSKYIYVEQI